MNDVTVTVSGFVGNNPTLFSHATKELEWTTFRVASTRRFMNEHGHWADGATLWFTVKAWRTAAQNVVKSVRRGDPVVVTGRLEVDEWTDSDGHQRMGLVITASAVGVDATKGKVEFSRVIYRNMASDSVPFDGEMAPMARGDGDPFELEPAHAVADHDGVAGEPVDKLVNA